jgi:hypothetical protein
VVSNYLQLCLGVDPATFETAMLEAARVADDCDDLSAEPERPVHVRGSHKSLNYRGLAIKRSKQWFSYLTKKHAHYGYTGYQWAVSAAQRPSTVQPVLHRLVERSNALLGLRSNHAIFTEYQDGRDFIGQHHDKTASLSPDEGDMIALVKTGEHGRLFRVSAPNDDRVVLWEERLQPGTLVLMSLEDNAKVRHGVPQEDEQVGRSSSVVMRRVIDLRSEEAVSKKRKETAKDREKRAEAKRAKLAKQGQ